MNTSLQLWHSTPDAPRTPGRVSAGEVVTIHAGTHPIAAGQSVWLLVGAAGEGSAAGRVELRWQRNEGVNSYWAASLGPFGEGTEVRYTLFASDRERQVQGSTYRFRVGPKIHLALLWHQHQPLYPAAAGAERDCHAVPWVRLHALRDYYSMAALLAEQPELHATLNLTPSLLLQLESYVRGRATDRALELTLTPAERLTLAEQEEMLGSFFDADWHHQVFVHPRFRELFSQRNEGRAFCVADLRDLQMWFNLAWFGSEFRAGEVTLVTGERASVRRFIDRGRSFAHAELRRMVAEQYKILRAIVPLHAELQRRGQIEVSTTPFYHPILPLLIDTDDATIDRPGAVHPARFAWPEDAEQQVRSACEAYRRWFGCDARGMWPAEGGVSPASIAVCARRKLLWLATDQGVLARSGRWGYDTTRAEVLCRAWQVCSGRLGMAIFFRDTQLSDAIGFGYACFEEASSAVADFVRRIRDRVSESLPDDEEDRLVTVILDGENAWGSYPDDGRPFLRSLYAELARLDREIRTVSFSEWIEGNAARNIRPHAIADQPPVVDLFTGSWIDENGSAPGVDLGTWIGEPEENRAWELLGRTRRWLQERGATPESAAAAFAAMYAAEGSDWFWWYGADQDSGKDGLFDGMFREHLAAVYRALDQEPPADLALPILPAPVVWTFAQPLRTVSRSSRLILRTNCSGRVRWCAGDGVWREQRTVAVGGVMAGASHHELALGPFDAARPQRLRFEFCCEHVSCPGSGPCCELGVREIEIE